MTLSNPEAMEGNAPRGLLMLQFTCSQKQRGQSLKILRLLGDKTNLLLSLFLTLLPSYNACNAALLFVLKSNIACFSILPRYPYPPACSPAKGGRAGRKPRSLEQRRRVCVIKFFPVPRAKAREAGFILFELEPFFFEKFHASIDNIRIIKQALFA